MPSHGELEVITGFHSTHAVSALVTHLFDETFPEHDATGRLLPGRFFAGRRILGTVVIVGMLADTLIASFLIPVSFYVVEKLAGAEKKRELAT